MPERPISSGSNSASKPANVSKPVTAAAPPANVPAITSNQSANPQASDAAAPAEQSCEQQTWPHLSPSCVAGAKQASQPVRVIPTRQADPATAMKAEDEPAGGVESTASAATRAAPEPKAAPPAPAPSPAQPARAAAEAHQKPDQQRKAENRPAPQPDAAEETRRPPRAAGQAPSRQRTARTRTYTERMPELAEEFADERPRVFIERDGTRIYVVPERRYVRRLDEDLWRQW
ncbi:MAG: hypothetical protein WD871_11795 [Xanthobacteraceae bacterium]